MPVLVRRGTHPGMPVLVGCRHEPGRQDRTCPNGPIGDTKGGAYVSWCSLYRPERGAKREVETATKSGRRPGAGSGRQPPGSFAVRANRNRARFPGSGTGTAVSHRCRRARGGWRRRGGAARSPARGSPRQSPSRRGPRGRRSWRRFRPRASREGRSAGGRGARMPKSKRELRSPNPAVPAHEPLSLLCVLSMDARAPADQGPGYDTLNSGTIYHIAPRECSKLHGCRI